MLHLPGNDQLICFSFKQNQLRKLWFYELILSFSPDFYPPKQNICYFHNLLLCVTQGIF